MVWPLFHCSSSRSPTARRANGADADHLLRRPDVRLSDEFFLIAWDTAGSGMPLLHVQATSLGLAGALLGELALAGRITIRGAEVQVVDRRPVEDALTQRVLNEMIGAPEHT